MSIPINVTDIATASVSVPLSDIIGFSIVAVAISAFFFGLVFGFISGENTMIKKIARFGCKYHEDRYDRLKKDSGYTK